MTGTLSWSQPDWANVPVVLVCCNILIEAVMRKVLEGRGSQTINKLMAGICEFGKQFSKFGKTHESLEGKDWFWGKKYGKEQRSAIGSWVTWMVCRMMAKEASKLLEEEGEKSREKVKGQRSKVKSQRSRRIGDNMG
jgi:hypothetical protein